MIARLRMERDIQTKYAKRVAHCISLRGAAAEAPYADRAWSSAATSGPSLGGFASRAILTPCFRSAALHTGPMEATSVRLKLAASGPCFPSFRARVNRLCACDAL